MSRTAIAGSLPKPSWLAETEKLWPKWKAQGAELQQAKLDATGILPARWDGDWHTVHYRNRVTAVSSPIQSVRHR